jgi:hypothetical protein
MEYVDSRWLFAAEAYYKTINCGVKVWQAALCYRVLNSLFSYGES